MYYIPYRHSIKGLQSLADRDIFNGGGGGVGGSTLALENGGRRPDGAPGGITSEAATLQNILHTSVFLTQVQSLRGWRVVLQVWGSIVLLGEWVKPWWGPGADGSGGGVGERHLELLLSYQISILYLCILDTGTKACQETLKLN